MHICQICQIEPATIHLTDIQNNVKNEVHMCEKCAKAKGFNIQSAASIPQLLGLVSKNPSSEVDKNTTCPYCGLKWSDFRNHGRFGCAHDYTLFKDKISVLLSELQGFNDKHIGKNPYYSEEETKLKNLICHTEKELKLAINHENYEQAIFLRDKLAELKNQLLLTSISSEDIL